MLVVRSVWCDIEVSPAFKARKASKNETWPLEIVFLLKNTHVFFSCVDSECYIKLVKVVQGISGCYVSSVVKDDVALGQIAILDYLDQ